VKYEFKKANSKYYYIKVIRGTYIPICGLVYKFIGLENPTCKNKYVEI